MLNQAARAVIDEQQDAGNDRYVFTGSRGGKLNIGKPFKTAWIKAGLPVGGGLALGVSNLHWTFEKRLENARVVREDREFLQWRGDIFRENTGTAPDLLHLLNCLEKISTPPQVAG